MNRLLFADGNVVNSNRSHDRRADKDAKIEGFNLALAIIVAVSVMLVAVFFAVKLSVHSGYMWPGFLPLFVGWAGLYPIFKRLENSSPSF